MTDPVTSVRLFTTIPAFGRLGSEYCRTVRLAGQLSEAAGFEGALIYSDNNTVDPWAVAQELISATERFKPLVAVQPAYMHPYTAAKQIASYGLLYGRRVCLNLVAGGSRKDLAALDDFTEHDERYHRLTEYAQLIRLLTAGTGPVTFDGEYYKVHNLTLFPTVPEHLRPELFISGSSEAGVLAGERLGAVPIRYPRPPHALDTGLDIGAGGVRLGVIARDTDEEAWQVAHERFPMSRAGQRLQKMAVAASDSKWLIRLSESDEFPGGVDSPYWMGPFKNYASFCPYLVGSYDKVVPEVVRYLESGCGTYIMDMARGETDYVDTAEVFDRALAEHRRATGNKGAGSVSWNVPAGSS
ncbi:LLM class flavin-dependent oxidoreductase [Kibdelosporangium lantanae]